MKEKIDKFTYAKMCNVCIIKDTINRMKSLPHTGTWYYGKYLSRMTWNPESILNAYTSLRKRRMSQWQKHKYSNESRK